MIVKLLLELKSSLRNTNLRKDSTVPLRVTVFTIPSEQLNNKEEKKIQIKANVYPQATVHPEFPMRPTSPQPTPPFPIDIE